MLTYTDHTVSRSFRDAVAAAIPGLGNNQAYWRFFHYIAFGTWRDEFLDELLVPASLVAAMEDKVCDANYSAIKFIQRFSRDTGIEIELRTSVHV